MRVFIGIEFQQEVLEKLYSLQNKLRGKVRKGRFPARDNMHLTLQFLGEVPDCNIPEIICSLESIAKTRQPFILSFNKQLGYFGQVNPARVVWVGVQGSLSSLLQLQSDIVSTMQGLGYPDEARAYHPHVTLAREADFINKELLREHGRIDFDTGPFPATHVERFSLISSALEQGKRIYRPLATFELARK